MADTPELESRVASLEARIEDVAADASAARHLAAARDRDLADLGVKVEAHRAAINGLGLQTAARFDWIERRFDRLEGEVRSGFAEVRAKLDQTAGGLAHIVDLLTPREDE